MTGVTCVLDVRAALGESPVWSAEERRLYWVNINGCSVNRFDPASGQNELCQLSEQVGSLALREQGGLVVALRSGFHFLDFDSAELTAIADPEADKPDNRFNDGRCGPDGRFWAGTMRDPQDPAQRDGALYCLDTDLSCRAMVGDIGVSNGLAFSPDGRTMYYADTRQETIWTYDFSAEDGTLSNRRVFATTHDLPGRPDGGCVDAEGFYWSANVDGWQMVRFAPTAASTAHCRCRCRSQPCPPLAATTWRPCTSPASAPAAAPPCSAASRTPAASSPANPAYADCRNPKFRG